MRTESISRRSLLLGSLAKTSTGICPPGASPTSLQACTGCGLCADHCPTGIIGLIHGLPTLDFTSADCTFCGECRLACPEPVFEQVAVYRFPHTATVTDACLAKQGVACQSCGESCPENAIRFRPRLGGPFLPELDEQLCTGCGACIQLCPAGAIATKPRELELSDV